MPGSCLDKTQKQGVRLVGTALKLGVKLNADEEIVLRQLNSFNQLPVWRGATDKKSVLRQDISICVINLVAVAMALAYLALGIEPLQERVF